MAHQLAPELRRLLLRAYEPCPSFEGACRSMRWEPERGHVPRGFCGATGSPDEIRLVIVLAEPGDPYLDQAYIGSPGDKIDSAYAHASEYLRSGRDPFHRNLLAFLYLCWPECDFEDIMRFTWITESVLCSAEVECGSVPAAVERACRQSYLERELSLLPAAVVIALGGKAQHRLRGIPGVIKAFSVAPPGCYQTGAPQSWREAALEFRRRIA